jgi:hypothetical protein
MNHLHTRTRRLVAAILLVGGAALGLTLSAHPATAHGSSSNGYVVSYYHHATLLGSTRVANGTGLDVVWNDTACSHGYGSPPAAFTWSNTSTGVTSAPFIGPCGHAPGTAQLEGPDNIECQFIAKSPFIECRWTYLNRAPADWNESAKIANPGGGTTGNVYLYARTVQFGYLVTPGKPLKKISVPAGVDTIKFTPAP